MRTLLVVVVLVASSVAAAQPGAAPPPPTEPQPQPYPPPQSQPQPYPPPQPQAYPPPQPYGYAQRPMQVQLTLDEQYLLERGYISDGQQVGGTIVAFMFGFGLGHAVQGRFMERGYLFAIGDAVTGFIFINGFVKLMYCFEGCSEAQENNAVNWLIVGALSAGVVRTWEIVDAAVGPSTHNRKLRALHMRLGMQQPMYTRLSPYLGPTRDGGGVAGVSLRF
jgi:hypothetical protein